MLFNVAAIFFYACELALFQLEDIPGLRFSQEMLFFLSCLIRYLTTELKTIRRVEVRRKSHSVHQKSLLVKTRLL